MPFCRRPTPAPWAATPLSAIATTAICSDGRGSPRPAATTTPNVCVTPSFSQVFLPWKDNALYTKSPGGDFGASLAGWSSQTPAHALRRATSRSSSALRGDRSSLFQVTAGASAISAPMCIDRTYPSFRFFARNLFGGTGDLKVEVLWQESGQRRTKHGRSGQEGRHVLDAGQVPQAPDRCAQHRATRAGHVPLHRHRRQLAGRRPLRRPVHAPVATRRWSARFNAGRAERRRHRAMRLVTRAPSADADDEGRGRRPSCGSLSRSGPRGRHPGAPADCRQRPGDAPS